ncbi:Membrane-associated tyrosine- and threonine-specific cdc2-inhibitory kinase [Araneus ventricosus]|uniref:Membrane-associated tyrosine- and threonine-specific cdc2-inhibitory kinase n=1 Tax=Araneus ventricosus TaxID=182803 RepID=A0A4Y2H2W0_ARAVE|nr:Membrane-associated tyrosine- and threonine-specific cdc2-inhibitory kinase [Araneus ventricosus]
MKSPLPTPKFYHEKSFSSKKERLPRSIVKPPPTPRVRYSSLGRSINSSNSRSVNSDRAQSISFRDSKSSLSSNYDSNSDQLYFHQCFEVICKLGSGSFGDVFKVKCFEDGKFYAVKKAKEPFIGKADRERKLQEVQKHEQLPSHPNCVKFYKAWEEKQILYIQIELCKCSLSQYAEENHDITENIVWYFLCDLLQAVKHLHDHNLVHLDIKPENIFITEDGICKLGDFGLVHDITKPISDACEGDPKYIAPEVMEGKFTKAADIFSLGITILEVAVDLDLPNGDETWHKLRNLQIPLSFLRALSFQLNQVITLMMEPNYEKRMSVDEILKLDVIKKMLIKRRKMIQSLELKKKTSGSDGSFFSDWSSNVSDDVFESIPILMNTSASKPCYEKSLSVDEQVIPNKSFESSRPRCGVSTPSSFRYYLDYHNSGSPCLSGSRRKQSSPRGDSSPVFTKSPRLQLFNSNSDDEDASNQPTKNLLSVFDALSPS